MLRGFPLAFLALLPLGRAQAQDEASTVLVVSCHQAASRLHLALETGPDAVPANEPGATVEKIDIDDLIRVSKEDAAGNVYRTGSKTLTRTCGRLVLKVSGGYFNSNPQGRMGAAPDHPVVELFLGKRRILPATAIGSCDTNESPTFDCPGGWATEVRAIGRDQPSIELHHDYTERLDADLRRSAPAR